MTFPSNCWHVLLLTTSVTIVLCYGVEEDQPEVFLPPRNFNPHPYATGYIPQSRASGDTGPVLFPETPPEPASVGLDAYAIGGADAYTSVAKKRKYQNQEGKNYVFSYKVLDRRSGDDYSHKQSQDGRATKGEYRVKLPDGRVQIVSYTADKNGYNAQVTYDDPYSHSQDKHGPNRLHYRYFEPSVGPTPATPFQNEAQKNEVDYITVRQKPYYNTGGKLRSYGAENYVGFVSSTAAPSLDYTRFTVTPKYNYL